MEGHLLCNGVFSDAASLSLFLCPHVSANTHIHIYFREASLGTTWRTILHLPWCNGGRVTDGMGRNGREIKRQYGAMEAGPKEGGSETERKQGGQIVSGSHIWWVKLAVINPAEWPCLCSVVCLRVVSVVLWGWEGMQAGTVWLQLNLNLSCVIIIKKTVTEKTPHCFVKKNVIVNVMQSKAFCFFFFFWLIRNRN